MRRMKSAKAMSLMVAALFAAAPAYAQNYPVKPVRIITGGAGTFHDIVTRQLGQRLGERWGQPVVVENQVAAALTVGTGIAARATPDGYTLVMSDRSALAVAPNLYKSVPYDPVRDFSPITLAALTPTMLVAHPSVPVATLSELLAYAKAQPREIHFATAGPGTNNHIAMELLKHATGVNAMPIHYQGGGASTQAIVSGEVKVGFGAVPSMLAHVKAGRSQSLRRHREAALPRERRITDGRGIGLAGFELQFLDGMVGGPKAAVLYPVNSNSEVWASAIREMATGCRVPGTKHWAN